MSFDSATRRKAKPNVSKACVNCRKAHLACNEERPCKRCRTLSKEDTCLDVDHKKRGRPKAQPNKPKPPKPATHASLPIIHPYSVQSSFKMTDNSNTTALVQNTVIATILLTMDLCCARISDEINDLLGFYPQEMTHRSLYTFITSENNDSLSKIHRHLLDNVVYTAQKVDPHYRYIHNPPTEQSTSEKFFEQNPQVLCSIANGSQSFTSVLYFKNSNGNVEPLQSQFCLGGGLGADLLYPSTLGSLYIICLLSKAHDAPLSAPSPSGMSTGSLSEHQPLPVPLVPANQWDLPYPESPSPLSSQSIQPQPQHPTQLVQSQSQNQQEQQKQPQLPQRYANSSSQHPLHQAPQQQTQPQQPSQGGYGFMNSSIQFMEHRGSMQEDTESYALHPSQRGSVPPYADRSMTNSAIKEESSALSCPTSNNSRFQKNTDKKKADFFKNDSVIHAAPISNSQRMLSKENRSLFGNQSSTLFRALNDIKDNNKTGFMSVEALLT